MDFNESCPRLCVPKAQIANTNYQTYPKVQLLTAKASFINDCHLSWAFRLFRKMAVNQYFMGLGAVFSKGETLWDCRSDCILRVSRRSASFITAPRRLSSICGKHDIHPA